MLICHLFSRRLQAALLLLGVKAGTVSYGELWPGQEFGFQQATWTLLCSQGSQDQIPHPKPFPRAGEKGQQEDGVAHFYRSLKLRGSQSGGKVSASLPPWYTIHPYQSGPASPASLSLATSVRLFLLPPIYRQGR